jgi:DNA-binding MarR family transcriptional regulator
MHEIANWALLSRSGLTRLVDRLEREGLIARERSSEDRRGAYAILTEKGLEALRQSWLVYAESIKRHFIAGLSEEEIAGLTKALTRIADTAYQKLQSNPKE